MSCLTRLIPIVLLPAALVSSSLALGRSFDVATPRDPRASAVTVSVAPRPGPPIYPGHGTQLIDFTITSDANVSSRLFRIAADIATDSASGDAETTAGEAIHGCLARWFRVDRPPPVPRLPVAVGAGGAYSGTLALRMIDAPVDQDACRDSRPAVTVIVS